MKKIIKTLLLITLTIVSASAQNSIYKGGKVMKINDSLTLECIEYGDNKLVELHVQSPVDIRSIHYESIRSVPNTSEFALTHAAGEDLYGNPDIRHKVLDIFCKTLTPEQFELFTKDSTQKSPILVWIYYNSSDGAPVAVYIFLVKDKPVFMELPPQVYGKFIEQIKQEIKLVDVKYKSTPYIHGSYNIQIKDVIRRYPELHK